jgi:hypothetical protein
MKRKVKRYDEGGILTDRYGNPVKSGSGEDVKTRYGSSTSKEDRPTSSGVEDYASMGKRAPAKSTWSGAPDIKEEKITETETESPKGIASGFKSGESKFERNDNEVKTPAAKRKSQKEAQPYKPKDASAVLREVKDITSESVKTPKADVTPNRYPSILEGESAAPKSAAKKEYYRDFSGKIKEKTPDTSSFKDFGDMISRGAGALGRGLSEYASKNIKSPAQRRDEEKASKGYAKGGKVSTASSRGDGIAQRGKTRGKMC